jgi:hypothetical protein
MYVARGCNWVLIKKGDIGRGGIIIVATFG